MESELLVSKCNCITAREFFAAHAPEKIPSWFKSSSQAQPLPEKIAPPYLHFQDNDLYRKYWDDDGDRWYQFMDIPDALKLEVTSYHGLYKRTELEYDAEKLRREHERYFEWPKYYADMMVEQLRTTE